MKRLLLSTLLAIAPFICTAQDSIDESSDPGYYGPVDLDEDTPPPDLVYTDPVVSIASGTAYTPLYFYVPPYYYQNWPQYCGYYNACYYPVYFVQPNWFWRTYWPHYHHHHRFVRSANINPPPLHNGFIGSPRLGAQVNNTNVGRIVSGPHVAATVGGGHVNGFVRPPVRGFAGARPVGQPAVRGAMVGGRGGIHR